METESIKLVPPSMDLVEAVHEAISESQQEFRVFLPWVDDALANPRGNMQTAIDNFNNFANELRFFIVNKSSGRLLGAISLIIRDVSVPYYEIGYWMRTSEAGKGYMTQAVKLLEQYAFVEQQARRVEIKMAEENQRSCAVAERCGYQMEALLKNHRRLISGELGSTLIFAKCR